MNYLLQNRHTFYQKLLPRIPDQGIRLRLEQISQYDYDASTPVPLFESNANSLLEFGLEDAVKKPNLGAKWALTTISIAEALDRAIHLEQLCFMIFEEQSSEDVPQAYNSYALRVGALRKLTDELRYHRLRLTQFR